MDGQLSGGNMNSVERVGDAVLRSAGPWTPTVHRYLDYIARAGVDWAPRPLGIEGDRERLSFIDGDVPLYPMPDWVWDDDVLRASARMLRQLHDASVGFPLDDAVWQLPARLPAEVICHNDFSPHNLAFDNGAIVGAIDFDMCSPGPRLWDIAYFATRIVPLTADTPPGEARRRVALLLDAYGSDAGWNDVLRMAIIRLHALADHARRKAADLAKPELTAHADLYERDAGYLARLSD